MYETLVDLLDLLGPRTVGTHFCNVGPAMHSLTRCDSDFSLFGIGKKTVFNVVMQKGVGRPFHGSEKNAHSNLSRLRLKLVNKKNRSLAKLPPCEASFGELARRVQWQTKVWMSSHVMKPNIGSPLEHGWERKSRKLVPFQWRQSSWKVSSAHAQVEFAAQTTVQSEQFVLHRAVHMYVMAMKTVKSHIKLAT